MSSLGAPDFTLTSSLSQAAAADLDVIIVGSGPAGTAVAEHLFHTSPGLRIGVLERGGILTLTHFNNLLPNDRRRQFLDRFGTHEWTGDLVDGIALQALGGRGIAAGGHLRRFDAVDYDLWAPEGEWPEPVVEALDHYYPLAEARRCVHKGDLSGEAQAWARDRLSEFCPEAPPVGVDFTERNRFSVGRGYDSSVARLWNLLLEDRLGGSQRLFVCTRAYVRSLVTKGTRITAVECTDAAGVSRVLGSRAFVLAASPIESARLVLHSRVPTSSQVVGQYLAEHIERRALVVLKQPREALSGDGISLVLVQHAEVARDRLSRFQIHLRGQLEHGDMVVAVGGFAAMDPVPDNCVELSRDQFGGYGVPLASTQLRLSEDDRARAARLESRIVEVASKLGSVAFVTERFPLETFSPQFVQQGRVQVMPPGRSYHEAGTLRMGADPRASATDERGRLHGVDNLYVADAALFPSVGIANPMLTVTALGYHVADSLARDLGVGRRQSELENDRHDGRGQDV